MPSEERRIALGDVAAADPGSFVDGPFGSNLKSSEYTPSGVRLIQLQNIGDGFWVDDNRKFISSQKFATLSRHGAVPGDIVIAKMAEPVARACIVPTVNDEFIVVADCIRLRPDQVRFHAPFVKYAINSWPFRREAERRSTGTTRLRISLSALKGVQIWSPALPEQRRVAEMLETLDEAIRGTEQVIAKLQQMKQGLLHDLLTRGIDENGELRDPARHPEQFRDSPLGRIPKAWGIATLGSVSSKITDGTHQAVETSESAGSTVPFLYVSCIRNGGIEWSKAARVSSWIYRDISRGREPCAGMVLYTAVGSYGNAAVVEDDRDFAFQRHIACIYPDQQRVSPRLLGLWLNGPIGRRHADTVALGNAQKTVTLGMLSEFPVLLPSRAEQQAIVSYEDGIASRLRLEEAGVSKLRTLKQGLREDLLTGRVRVPITEEATP